MVTPEKAEQLSKDAVAIYLHLANPLVAGDTQKLLMKLRGVIDRQIEEMQNKATKRLTREVSVAN